MRRVTVAERRARLARRHHLAAEAPAGDVVALAEALVGLHATDPATVFLSAWARIPGLTVGDVESALYDEVSVVKHLAMRRTLWVEPMSLLPMVQAACSDAVAVRERTRLATSVQRSGLAPDGRQWLARVEADVLAALAAAGGATGAQLSRAVPALQAKASVGDGKWGVDVGVATRVLTIMAVEGRIRRGRPNGSWTSSQHRWVVAPATTEVLDVATARRELVRRWLHAFGPATVADLAWWTGLGVTVLRPALAALDVATVDVDGAAAVVLPDDSDEVEPVAPWAALLPALDPTVMGWQERQWYLGEHRARLFDRNGNAGPTVWWDGRVVGGWSQRASGEVVVALLEDVGAEAQEAIEARRAVLAGWLGTTVVAARFRTPLDVELRAG